MRKITIIILSLLLVIVIGFLTLPLATGLWLQKKYPQMIANLNNVSHTSFRVSKFNFGWFHSQAELISNDENPLSQYVIKQKIYQGPIIYLRNINGSPRLKFARIAVRSSSKEANLDFNAVSLWTLNNLFKNQFIFKHLLWNKEQENVDFNELQGQLTYQPAKMRIKTRLQAAGAEVFIANPERVEKGMIDLIKVASIQDLQLNLDVRQSNQLWYGERHFRAKNVAFFPYVGAKKIVVNNWHLDFTQIEHSPLTDLSISNHIDSLQMNPMTISQFQMNLSIKDVNTAALSKLANESGKSADLHRFKLYALLIGLFNQGMTFDLNQLQFSTADGPVSLRAKISTPPPSDNHTGWFYVLENLYANANLDLPKTLAEKGLINFYQIQKNAHPELKINPSLAAQDHLNYWLAQGILVPKDHQVQMDLEFQNGKLVINGEKAALQKVIMDELFHNKNH